MGREEQRANREARRDMVEEPARQRPHESSMAAFVAGMAYEEEQRDEAERERRERDRQA
jgi:hypothetical protein